MSDGEKDRAAKRRARVSLRVAGRVQGVGFRWAAIAEARRLELSGWVRNRADGAVEIVAEGDKDNLALLAEWAKRGPRMAEVSGVEVKWSADAGEFSEFRMR